MPEFQHPGRVCPPYEAALKHRRVGQRRPMRRIPARRCAAVAHAVRGCPRRTAARPDSVGKRGSPPCRIFTASAAFAHPTRHRRVGNGGPGASSWRGAGAAVAHAVRPCARRTAARPDSVGKRGSTPCWIFTASAAFAHPTRHRRVGNGGPGASSGRGARPAVAHAVRGCTVSSSRPTFGSTPRAAAVKEGRRAPISTRSALPGHP